MYALKLQAKFKPGQLIAGWASVCVYSRNGVIISASNSGWKFLGKPVDEFIAWAEHHGASISSKYVAENEVPPLP